MTSKFYNKEKVIGSGTFGSVWLVKSKINKNPYVLKEVKLTSLNPTEKQQALTEVTILSRCKHVNIIKYKDAAIDHNNGMLSIIMEYADGGDLYTAIINQQGVPFKEHTVITWFLQICLALQYIHHKNILHRDLKTRNIFLTLNKEVKVGDFGIARCLHETNQLATTSIGTPYYLSPEICQRKPYNHKSDIWALGCILFEIAALSHPFHAASFPHLISLILTGQRRELPSHCSPLIQHLVGFLLDENPETRPSTDQILSINPLQPHLAEIWMDQGSKDSTLLSELLNPKINVPHHSEHEGFRKVKEAPMRRASIASVDSSKKLTIRGEVRSRFSSASRVKDGSNSRSSSLSRCILVKGQNNSPSRTVKADILRLTYKVFHPVSLKKIVKSSSHGKNTNMSESCSKSKKNKTSHLKNKEESDCGYQSDEVFKTICDKTYDFRSTLFPIETSTKKCIEVPSLLIDKSPELNQVFESNINSSVHYCQHSQCQQCMLDMLWKNRIRGTVGYLVKNERSELVQKLEAVFSANLFETLYLALMLEWEENESERIPSSFKGITESLNYSQLQHIPLMMQLIQLDLLTKING